jgi:hypothetical protein
MPSRIDLTGQTFGSWTALEPRNTPGGTSAWLCRCICGTERVVQTGNLKSGKSTNCGCLKRVEVEAGMTFGYWTVLEFSFVRDHRAYYWCKCICGVERDVCKYDLAHGRSTSCGCDGRPQLAVEGRTPMYGEKRCTGCGRIKPATLDHFDYHETGEYKLRARCKDCRREEAKAERLARNPNVRVHSHITQQVIMEGKKSA